MQNSASIIDSQLVGNSVGAVVGCALGEIEGVDSVGFCVGSFVGVDSVGENVGNTLGDWLGSRVGFSVGC